MTERHRIWKLADQIQMDLNAAQAKLVELRSIIASLSLPELEVGQTTCPEGCGPMPYGARRLAEHLHTSHGYPLTDGFGTGTI